MSDFDDLEDQINTIKETLKHIREQEDHYAKEITKYFDRIHDKLFNLNALYIAGYVALITFHHSTPKIVVVLPFLNCCFLVYIDWRMMETSRMQSKFSKLSDQEKEKSSNILTSVNLVSLLMVITTFLVTVILFGLFVWL